MARSSRDNPGGALKFTVPTVANGRVYVGAAYKLAVFGVSNFLSAPQISPGGGNFTNSILVAITEAAPGTAIYYTLDNSLPTTNSTLYTDPFVVTNSVAIRARAFKADYVDSITSMVTFYQNTLVGSGTGLQEVPAANGVQVEVSGLTGKGYTLQVSTNLAAWFDLQTILPDPDPNNSLPTNLFYFTDTNQISCQRFYRTRQEP
ncbi:MAG TPA: chitobiase/beta-hexosaminidase C-terminal domain-containing protein [Verrucomicrobiae bacterium]